MEHENLNNQESAQLGIGAVMRSPYLQSPEPAIIQDEFKAYEVSWKCKKGHINFQTILKLGTQTDICLKCGKHYEYVVS
jgi:hypothetical protein